MLETKYKDNNETQKLFGDSIHYKTTLINNRRYLGNKYKLLSFIKDVVSKECKGVNSVADIFAGTGAVASAFNDKKLITNDILYFNYLCHIAWFSPDKYDKNKIISLITYYNSKETNEDNYVSQNFSNTFFREDDCRKIGFIRQDIEDKFIHNEINFRERALLITSLLYSMDKVANTCGHYDAYRKNGELIKRIELCVPLAKKNNKNNVCYNVDANDLVKKFEADLVYIDPPYNSRQYCDAYHLLENIARWEKPKVYGESRKMDRTKLKSKYCSNTAVEAFEDLVNNIKAKYILLSYNNMAEKGNARSNAKIADEDIIRILSAKGKVKIFTEDYKAFTTGKSNIKNNQERLFLCICKKNKKADSINNKLIKSPLNYMGGKYKLLPQILPLFPKNISYFIDLFCGGCSVGLNVNSKETIFNDKNSYLLNLYNTFKELKKDETFKEINDIITKYNLSRSDLHSYNFYDCNGNDGLAKYNNKGFSCLKADFNAKTKKDNTYYLMLYILIMFSFNNQLRFNKKGEFNLPVGKRDFNKSMREKLLKFIDSLKNHNYIFLQKDFREIDISEFDKNSFIYADPPYLITNATYNEKSGWTVEDEKSLLRYLDNINNKGYKFALSNVLENKGKKNDILYDWLKQNKDKYKVIHLSKSYTNSNYHATNKENITDEVLIINY